MKSVARLIQDGNIQALKKLKNIRTLVKGYQPGTFETQVCSLVKPTLLQLAVGYEKEEIVELLLGYGADPNDVGGVFFSFIVIGLQLKWLFSARMSLF